MNRNHWTELPIPNDIIRRVHQVAESVTMNKLVFGDRNNGEADEQEASHSVSSDSSDAGSERGDGQDDNHDGGGGDSSDNSTNRGCHRRDATEDEQDQSQWDEIDHDSRGVQLHTVKQEIEESQPYPERAQEDDHAGYEAHNDDDDEDHPDVSGATQQEEENDDQSHTPDQEEMMPNPSDHQENENINTFHDNDQDAHDNAGTGHSAGHAEVTQRTLSQRMGEMYGERTGRHSLRARRKTIYNNRNKEIDAQVGSDNVEAVAAQVSNQVIGPHFDATRSASLDNNLEPLFNVLLTQYGVNKGLRLFGEKGDDAVKAEMLQLHRREVMMPKSGPLLTDQHRRDYLSYLMFLKQKTDGTRKGRGCADGKKQHGVIDKPNTSTKGRGCADERRQSAAQSTSLTRHRPR